MKKPPDLENCANRKSLSKTPIVFRKEGARSVDKHRLVAQGQLTSKGSFQMAAVALSRLLKKKLWSRGSEITRLQPWFAGGLLSLMVQGVSSYTAAIKQYDTLKLFL